MTEPTLQERSRLARVAPWSMLGIVIFGFFSAQYGLLVASAISAFLMVAATFLFPKSGAAASFPYKTIFVLLMASCFIGIAILVPVVFSSYQFAVWLLLYFAAVGCIEVAGMVLEHRNNEA
ncbi:MAG: hypothetical protein WD005_00790 [Haliea sp.]